MVPRQATSLKSAICANPALCERLLSLFGLILTRLRHHLGTQKVTQLAELKMHVRDEDQREQKKQRLMRHFGKVVAASGEPAESPLPPSAAPGATGNIDATFGADAAGELGMDSDGAETAQSERGTNSIQKIASTLSAMVDEDEDEAPVDCPSSLSITLAELFDPSLAYWEAETKKSYVRGIDEELEVYDLLELDAAGEEDLDALNEAFDADTLLG